MIPRTIPTWQEKSWQESLADMIRDPDELLDLVELDESWQAAARRAHRLFPVRTTRSFVARIGKGDPDDPLLRQVLPLGLECDDMEGFSADPLDERNYNIQPGVLHKYHGRVLLIAANQCAINCRYCFRRHFDYAANNPNREAWRESLGYIAANADISEVILSGGDPLVLNQRQLEWLCEQIANIPHVKRLRIHSRLPIVLPQRVYDGLPALLESIPQATSLVIHCNHPAEIDDEVREALAALRGCCTLLNQSVLLKGVNDDADTLCRLSEALFDDGVLPYYVHMLDPVSGAHHFSVAENTALAIRESMRSRLPGYLLPRFVFDRPGAIAKTPLDGMPTVSL